MHTTELSDVSVGIAALMTATETPASLVQESDQALYRAKNTPVR